MKKIALLFFIICWKDFFAQQTRFNQSFDYNIQYDNGGTIVEVDDGYLLIGQTSAAFASEGKRLFFKTDLNGNLLKVSELFLPNHKHYLGKAKRTIDSNVVIIGSIYNTSISNSYIHLLKINNEGDTLFTRTFQYQNLNSGEDIIQTHDNGFAILGWTAPNSSSTTQIYLAKTDVTGNKLWEKTYGGNENDVSYSVIQLDDKGFFIVGYTYSYGAGDRDCYLIRTDSLGNKLWQKTYGTSGDEGGSGITKTRDGNFVITGWKQDGKSGGFNILRKWICKIDSDGKVIWEKIFGEGDKQEGFSTIYELYDGSFSVIGNGQLLSEGIDKGIIARISSKGDLLWDRVYHKGMPTGDNYFYDFKPTSDGGYIVAGTSRDSATFQDAWLLKLDCFGCDGELCNFGDSLCTYEDTSVFVPEYRPNNEAFLGQNIPNPFSNSSNINCFVPEQINDVTLIITDALGKILYSQKLFSGDNTITIDANQFKAGLYFYGVSVDGKFQPYKRMVIVK